MNKMDEQCHKIRNAHNLCKDTAADGSRLSKADDMATASLMYQDIEADLEAYRNMLAKLGCPKAEALVKAMIQNCADVKSAMDTEMVNSK